MSWFDDDNIDKKTISENVVKVMQLLINEDQWCKRALARDKDGNSLFDPSVPQACQWCIYGALYKINAIDNTIAYLQSFARAWGYSDIDRLNDTNQHFFIVQFLKDALRGLGLTYRIKYIKVPV